MRVKRLLFCLFFVGLLVSSRGIYSLVPADKGATHGDVLLGIKIYKGSRAAPFTGRKIVSSYYLKPLFIGNMISGNKLSKEKEELKRVFNLKFVKLLTSTQWGWKEGRSDRKFQLMVVNGHEFLIKIKMKNAINRFNLQVIDTEKQKDKSLLDTDILLSEEKSLVFGFEDSFRKPYFLSINRYQNEALFRKDALLIPSIDMLKQTKRTAPIYPQTAINEQIEGEVILIATTDVDGTISSLREIKGPPVLVNAAKEAVSQWQFEPFRENDVNKAVTFTVSFNFSLPKKTQWVAPKLTHRVKPVYPARALQDNISGPVKLRITIDNQGNVRKVEKIDGPSVLSREAKRAIRQWKYKPFGNDKDPVLKKYFVYILFLKDGKKHSVKVLTGRNEKEILESIKAIPCIWPTRGYLTDLYGWRTHPLTGKKDFHKGIDIAAQLGNKVVATADGEVLFAGYKSYYGNMVIIDHSLGYVTWYGHLASVVVKPGQMVKRGHLIGYVGSTGRSNTPHLHYEIRHNRQPINPFKLIIYK